MPTTRKAIIYLTLTTACIGMANHPSSADPVADFYKGKQVKLNVGTGPGGAYDTYARTLGRQLGKHIPGQPAVIMVNMPGAASLKAANYLATVAPKDGTELLAVVQSLPLVQAFDRTNARFDLADFNWIGNMSDAANATISWHTAPVKTIQEAQERELILGSTAPGSIGHLYPVLMNNVLGTRFKVINGYDSGESIDLALERGEVQGRGGMSWTGIKSARASWLQKKQINVLVQIGLRKEPDLPNVPLLTDLARNPQEREVLQFFSSLVALGRAVTAGPGVPPERVQALRRAFDATMKDPEFMASSEKQQLEVSPLRGEELQEIVTAMVHASPEVLERAKQAIDDKNAAPAKDTTSTAK